MGDRERLLIADDLPFVRSAIVRAFNEDGKHEVVAEAGNPDEVSAALQDFKNKPFTVALLDGNMPKEGDGERSAAEIRAQQPDVRIVSFSSTSIEWGDVNLPKGTRIADVIKVICEL